MTPNVDSKFDLIIARSSKDELTNVLLAKSTVISWTKSEEFCCNAMRVVSALARSRANMFSHPVHGWQPDEDRGEWNGKHRSHLVPVTPGAQLQAPSSEQLLFKDPRSQPHSKTKNIIILIPGYCVPIAYVQVSVPWNGQNFFMLLATNFIIAQRELYSRAFQWTLGQALPGVWTCLLQDQSASAICL